MFNAQESMEYISENFLYSQGVMSIAYSDKYREWMCTISWGWNPGNPDTYEKVSMGRADTMQAAVNKALVQTGWTD